MKENITAGVYAKALFELGAEKNFDIAEQMTSLTVAINSSNDLENVLFLDVFSNEEKTNVLTDIAGKLSMNSSLLEAIQFLIQENRIGILPLIYKEIMVMDDDKKGFLRGTIEGDQETISEEEKAKLLGSLNKYTEGKKALFEYKQNKNIAAGYRVTVDGVQLDASVNRQLDNFKSLVLENK